MQARFLVVPLLFPCLTLSSLGRTSRVLVTSLHGAGQNPRGCEGPLGAGFSPPCPSLYRSHSTGMPGMPSALVPCGCCSQADPAANPQSTQTLRSSRASGRGYPIFPFTLRIGTHLPAER